MRKLRGRLSAIAWQASAACQSIADRQSRDILVLKALWITGLSHRHVTIYDNLSSRLYR